MVNKRIEAEKIKLRIAKKYFKNKCYFCGCKISKRGMTIHHRWYIFNDVIYSNYPKTTEGQLQYYTDLEPVIKADPERFRFTCNTDHQSLERLIRFGDIKLKKLLRERKISKTKRQ